MYWLRCDSGISYPTVKITLATACLRNDEKMSDNFRKICLKSGKSCAIYNLKYEIPKGKLQHCKLFFATVHICIFLLFAKVNFLYYLSV